MAVRCEKGKSYEGKQNILEELWAEFAQKQPLQIKAKEESEEKQEM